MAEYLAPGVYVEEIERGPRPIEGVPTSTTAFLGETERGPLRPTFVASYGEYLRLFGNVFTGATGEVKYLPFAVKSFFENGGRRAYIARVAGDGAAPAGIDIGGIRIRSVGPGAACNRIRARIDPGRASQGGGAGFRLRIAFWDRPDAALADLADPFQAGNEAAPKPSLIEVFDDLSLDPESPSYWAKRVNNGNSALVTIDLNTDFSLGGLAPAGQSGLLTGGYDGATPGPAAFEGEADEAHGRTGLAALELEAYREVAIVCAPAADVATARAVIAHCEQDGRRFAVIDCPAGQSAARNLDPRSSLADSKYAAFYYPWMVVSDPRDGTRVTIPPSGAVCGIYARTDNTRGIWKAPANEIVFGALDLEYDVSHGAQELLNPRGVNVIRRFPGRGIRVWGARTLASDPLWKYVNVRRLVIFLEASIERGISWAVFEPNDERLWARVKQTITLFLRSQWRDGALFGEREEEAFSVTVGRETMTEDDIMNGWLIVEIGIAPVRPAEFVIFRVYQKTQEAGG